MGTKINAQIGENEKFAESAIVMFYFFVNKLMKPWLKINFIYKFTKDYRKHTETVKEFRTFGEKVSYKLIFVFQLDVKQFSGFSTI